MILATRRFAGTEPAQTPPQKSYVGVWLLAGFGFLFWLAHKADQYPIRQREERERERAARA